MVHVSLPFAALGLMQPELELVMMGEDEDSRKHFSLKAILDQERPKKRKGKKRKEKEEVREQECNEVDKLYNACDTCCGSVHNLRQRSRTVSRLTWKTHASLLCMSRPCLQLTPPTPSTSE